MDANLKNLIWKKLQLLKQLVQVLAEGHTEEQLLKNDDMKRMPHLSDSNLYRLRKANAIPYLKLGGKYYYPKHQILALLH
jgi:hypothetical protein